ncbi:MAG: TIGR04282 family arsenosugar biosynthesis glycosyltransferase [Desulforhopalus sp.]
MPIKSQLLIFTRYPEPGSTKTRLIGELGADKAAELHKKLTERLVNEARQLEKYTKIPAVIHYCGGSREKIISWLGPMVPVKQTEGDLGARMAAAFTHAFSGGVGAAILVGTDIPDISVRLLGQAFSALQQGEVVIGPSCDGGYYLIGLRVEQAPELLPLFFTEMRWSSSDLFKITMDRLAEAGYEATILPTLRDIDLPDDLPFARSKGLL